MARTSGRIALTAAGVLAALTLAGSELAGAQTSQPTPSTEAQPEGRDIGPTNWRRLEIAPSREVQWEQGPARPSRRNQPNIILILADDLGYNDITFNGGGVAGGTVPTPNIDSIGRDGVNFVQGYTGHGTCAPSRAAMMTGRYQTRFGYEFTPVPLSMARRVRQFDYGIHDPVYYREREAGMIPYADMGVPTSEIMIPRMLQQSGYHSIHIGKWHLGEATQFRPQARGFDESLGFTAGAQFYLPPDDPRGVSARLSFDPIDQFLWAGSQFYIRQDSTDEVFQPARHTTDYLSEQAVAAIRANRNRPFFMFLAYSAPHTPLQATREDYEALSHIEDHTLRVYAAMIRQLDRGIGQVLQALQEEGIDENTLVIFTSDNGGAYYLGLPDINRPFRGWKQTFFEGGIRAPYFMRWPARIPAGSTYYAPVSHFDIFPTVAAAARVRAPRDRVIDGVDLMPFVRGERQGRPHEVLFWRTGPYQVVRQGDWKLQIGEIPAKEWLFDLSVDPTERNNLAEQRPEVVARLRALLEAHNAEQAPSMWPQTGASPVMVDHPLSFPQSESDEYVYWGN